ncbi:sensor histidine kinase [Cohnella yongneupensis]|uniref:histidine kinase n=1 Tax=Cohnella yongneupensis TaxID=425006 RepID=A0ABW0QXS8_9BACL
MIKDTKERLRGNSSRLWSAFMNLGIEKRLILVFLLLVIIPVTSISYVSYGRYSKSIESNATEYVTEMSGTLMSTLDNYINDLMNVTIIPLYASWPSYGLQELLQDPSVSLQKERQIDNYIELLSNFKQGTDSIYIFDNFGHVFYKTNSEGLRKDIQERYEDWSKQARESNKPLLMSTHEISTSNTSRYVFSIIQDIKNTSTLESVGTFVIDANMKVIEKEIQGLDRVTKGKTIIVDSANRVIYDSKQALLAQDLTGDPAVQRAVDDNGSFKIDIDHQAYIVQYLKSKKTQWKMLVYTPISQLNKEAVTTQKFTIIASLIIIGFALCVSVYLSFALTNPLQKMARLMRKVQEGDLEVRFNIKYSDEVGVLGKNFNRMIKHIKELIEEIHVTGNRKRIAEMEALQSQINPHFIYNTLETLRMTALIHDDKEMSNMIYSLGQLLRYSINRGNEVVTLRDELEHLTKYLQLQNYRFEDKFIFEPDMPESLMDCKMIKLLLQPIVENAIFHGLENKKHQSIIRITAAIEQGKLVCLISDNGDGMDEDTLHLLRAQIDADDYDHQSKHGIGLRNVHQRIKLHYGHAYGLEIESEPGVGTTVKLCLPYEEYVEEIA